MGDEATRVRKPTYIQDSEGEIIIYGDNESLNNDIRKTNRSKWNCKVLFKFVSLIICNITVEPIMFLYMFSTYLYLALIELYFYQQFGLKALRENSNYDMPNHSFCVNTELLDSELGNGTNDKVEGKAALVILLNSSLGQVTSVVVALIAGPLSDKYGRRPALLFALLGNVIAAIINMLLVYFKIEVYYFIGTGLLMGATGGFTIVMTVCVAYLADVSSKRWLTLRIAILQAMLYVSQALSDAVTGQWLTRSGCDFNPLMWMAIVSGILGVLYLILVREPFTKEIRLTKLKVNGSLSISSLLTRGFKILFSHKYSRWRLWFTLVILSISIINGIGAFEILTLFQIHEPLKWGPGDIGWYGLSNTLVQAFSLFVLLPILVAIKVPDTLIILVGLLFSSGMNFFIGFLKTSWEMYLVGVLAGLDPTIIPIIRAVFSKLVSQEDQGSLFAVVTAVQVLSAAFASVLYNTAVRQLLGHHLHPGLAFVMMGILGLLPIPLTIVLFMRRKVREKSHDLSQSHDVSENEKVTEEHETLLPPDERH